MTIMICRKAFTFASTTSSEVVARAARSLRNFPEYILALVDWTIDGTAERNKRMEGHTMTLRGKSDTEVLLKRLARLSVSGLADQFDKFGIVPPVLARELKPIGAPVKFSGPAFCVRGCKHEDAGWKAMPGPRDSLYDSLDEKVPPGAVLVFDTGGYDDTAVFGGGTALALKQRRCAGAVIDGAVRDVEELVSIGLPTVARTVSPVRFVGRFSIRDIACAIEVRGLAGLVAIVPGDFVLADHDGVIVLPVTSADEIIGRAEEAARIDALVKADVLHGVSRLEASRRHGKA
jgi:4-hydroxy-4-methyl-2-oxoglutarate aldolase